MTSVHAVSMVDSDPMSKLPDVTTVSNDQVSPPDHGDTVDVKRLSCALSTPAILKIRSHPTLDATPLDAVAYIRRHGLV